MDGTYKIKVFKWLYGIVNCNVFKIRNSYFGLQVHILTSPDIICILWRMHLKVINEKGYKIL
jgi:hypothetical protein